MKPHANRNAKTILNPNRITHNKKTMAMIDCS